MGGASKTLLQWEVTCQDVAPNGTHPLWCVHGWGISKGGLGLQLVYLVMEPQGAGIW
jgi:hypothetical protein